MPGPGKVLGIEEMTNTVPASRSSGSFLGQQASRHPAIMQCGQCLDRSVGAAQGEQEMFGWEGSGRLPCTVGKSKMASWCQIEGGMFQMDLYIDL